MANEGSQNGSRTPTNNTQSQQQSQETAELSPPGSQQAQHSEASGATGDNAAEGPPRPGASWMNQRAREEYDRAMEYVVDKDFSTSASPLLRYPWRDRTDS